MQIAVIEEKKVLDACQDARAVFVDKRRERHTLPDVSSKGWGHRMNWIDVNEARPEGSCFVLVACEGGNVATTFYCENPEYFDYAYGRKLSRKVHGKWSKHFDLARAYGYKITHWAPLPKAPNAPHEGRPAALSPGVPLDAVVGRQNGETE